MSFEMIQQEVDEKFAEIVEFNHEYAEDYDNLDQAAFDERAIDAAHYSLHGVETHHVRTDNDFNEISIELRRDYELNDLELMKALSFTKERIMPDGYDD